MGENAERQKQRDREREDRRDGAEKGKEKGEEEGRDKEKTHAGECPALWVTGELSVFMETAWSLQ